MRFFTLLIATLLSFPTFAQTAYPTISLINLAKDPRVDWLKKNNVTVRTVDPQDENFTDLGPLKTLIGNSQVVMLGEQTHQDGTTDSAKIRLIKFLHQEMNFDVLAFESGFYDVGKSWQELKKGKSVYTAFRSSVFFAAKDAYQPLISYLGQALKTTTPMEVIGFDSQITGTPGKDSLHYELKRFFSSIGVETTHFDDTAVFAKHLQSLGTRGGYKTPDREFYVMLARMGLVVDRLKADSLDAQTKYYVQLFKSVRKAAEQNLMSQTSAVLSGSDQYRSAFYGLNMRDAQMADNLLWYLRQNPKRKVIVWAHNFHIATSDVANEDPLKHQLGSNVWRDSTGLLAIKPMGEYLREALGDKVYSISFTAYSGSTGNVRNGAGKTTPIKEDQRPQAEFEELMNATGADFAFVDLRRPSKGGEWLRKRLIARPLINTAIEGEWYRAADGFFFIRKMSPATFNN
jgi:erythromycin esterase